MHEKRHKATYIGVDDLEKKIRQDKNRSQKMIEEDLKSLEDLSALKNKYSKH